MQWNEVDSVLPPTEESISGLLLSRPVIIYNARNEDAMVGKLCVGFNNEQWWIVRGVRVRLTYATHWIVFPTIDSEQKITFLERYYPSRGY